jgi:hypothetical protein
MRTWACLALAISLAPPAIWAATVLKERRENPATARSATAITPRETATAAAAPEPALATATTGTVSTVSGTTTGGN